LILSDEFEQLVWKSTSQFGIAYATKEMENGQILSVVVANYYPGANGIQRSQEEKKLNIFIS